jgi:hypothetical protein
MKKSLFLLIAVLGMISSNCYTGQFGNPSGTVFINKGNNGFSGTSFDPKDRQSEACATSVLALFAFGDASIQKAANKAGITKITSVSHDTKQNMFVIQDVCTVVRGQ